VTRLPSLAGAALALVVGSPAIGAPEAIVEIEAAGFRITSAVGERAARDYLAQLHRFNRLLEQTLGVKRRPNQVPTRLFLAGAKNWETTLRPRDGVVGFWSPGRFRPVLVVDGSAHRSETRRIVLHEYAHDFLQTQLGRDTPPWWDEGFADFMSSVELRDDRAVFSAPLGYLQTLRSGAWIPMESVITADRNSSEYQSHQLAASFYAQSWLLVYYGRVEDRAFGERLEKLALAYDQGASVRASVKSQLGMEMAELDALMRGAVRRFRAKTTVVELPKEDVGPLSPARIVSRREAAQLVAEILVDADAPRRAIPLLDALLASTKETSLLALRALAAAHAGEPDAETWFARADSAAADPGVETPRSLGLILLMRAEAETEPGDPISEATASLARRSLPYFERALATAPDDLESAWGFGLASYFAEDDLAPAQEHVARVRAVAEDSAELAYVAALLAERQGELEAAREAWRVVVRYARFPTLRDFARDRLLALATEG
jgi:tetratricopeptide (TPR) repeat protein